MGPEFVVTIELGQSVLIAGGLGFAAGLSLGIVGVIVACLDPSGKSRQEDPNG